MVSGRSLITNFGGPLLRPDTELSSVNHFPISPGTTVGVALGSHMAERKCVRAHGVRDSVF